MKTAQQIAADCGIVGDDCDRLSAMLEDRYPSECDQQAAEIMKLLVKRIKRLEVERVLLTRYQWLVRKMSEQAEALIALKGISFGEIDAEIAREAQ